MRVRWMGAIGVFAVASAAGQAGAAIVLTVTGTVNISNLNQGPWAGVTAGTPASLRMVMEETGVETIPGQEAQYALRVADFSMTVGGISVGLSDAVAAESLAIENDHPTQDGLRVVPDILTLSGSSYTFRYQSHDFQGVIFSSDNLAAAAGVYPPSDFEHLEWSVVQAPRGMLVDFVQVMVEVVPECDDIDFNNDGLFPDTTDIFDFLAVFSGAECPSASGCNDVDFNNDEVFPDTADLTAFLRVFSGGECATP